MADVSADNLTIYLEYNQLTDDKNNTDIENMLNVLEQFCIWSGLRVNVEETYLTVFGSNCTQPRLKANLKIIGAPSLDCSESNLIETCKSWNIIFKMGSRRVRMLHVI